MRTSIVIGCALILSFACTDKGDKGAPPPAATQAPAPALQPESTPVAPPPAPTATAEAPKVELEISSVGNLMAFDKTKLTVPTGAQVHLVFKNKGAIEVMQHNWVLVMPGKEASVAAAGLKNAPDAGYVGPGPDVLAYTPLTKPGENAETTFTAPAPGTYPYICTFPGHYVVMKGVLTVTP